MEQECCICVFAKPPRPGDAKTRLIPTVGADGSAALADAFLQDTWLIMRQLPWARAVIASTDPLHPKLLGGSPEVWLQGEGDLGARIERILRRALSATGFAIAIGADSPGLPSRVLEKARFAMREADGVIGPCEDGGFYLLGLRRCPIGLLKDITWSGACTCEEVLARLQLAGMNVAILDPWFDVDRPEDLAKLCRLMESGEIHAPRTEATLKRLERSGAIGVRPRISAVIPVLDEREWLPRTISDLQTRPWIHEIIVADGGSTDGTREWLSQQTGVIVVDTPRGRGNQINAGAVTATGEVFMMLHADCMLPADAGEKMLRALQNRKVAGGCFLVRFAEKHPASLRCVSAGINLRTRLCRSATGDQAIFIRRQAFETIQGLPDWPLFEDVELVNRVKRLGRFAVLPAAVTLSPRRYLRYGVFKTAFLFYGLRLAFWAGVSPLTLKRWLEGARPRTGASA